MEWAILFLLISWKYDRDMKELRRKADQDEKKWEKQEELDQAEFIKSLEGKSPEEVTEAYRQRGAAISAAAACAAAACLI